MTAEAMTTHNQRKFIPILRRGAWLDSAPSWLLGKYYVDLRGDSYSESNYGDLLRTLLGTRDGPPPVGRGSVVAEANAPPRVAEPDFTLEVSVVEGLSYSADRDQGYERIAQLALQNSNVDAAMQAIKRMSYASDRDRLFKIAFEHCLKRGDLTVAAKVLEGFSYSSDRDAARKRLLRTGSA